VRRRPIQANGQLVVTISCGAVAAPASRLVSFRFVVLVVESPRLRKLPSALWTSDAGSVTFVHAALVTGPEDPEPDAANAGLLFHVRPVSVHVVSATPNTW
jgi:hypothetical protein